MPAPPPNSGEFRIAEHTGEVIAGLALLGSAAHWLSTRVNRLLKRRAQRRELEAARDEVLRALVDKVRSDGHLVGDAAEIAERRIRMQSRLDEARDRLWLAHGRQRSAPPSAAPPPQDEDDDA